MKRMQTEDTRKTTNRDQRKNEITAKKIIDHRMALTTSRPICAPVSQKNRLENGVDNVAANSRTGAENRSVSQLLAKLLALFLKLAGYLAGAVAHLRGCEHR